MMNTEKHTPIPWIVTPTSNPGRMRDKYLQSWALVESGKNNLIAGIFSDVRGGEETSEANARFIAFAVNNHAPLVAALEALINAAEQDLRICESMGDIAKKPIAIKRANLDRARELLSLSKANGPR